MSNNTVLFSEQKTQQGQSIGIATLNQEKALNAISLSMIKVLDDQLRQWQTDTNIVCVILQGAGEKAFCAGGDIRQLYQSMIENPGDKNEYAESFFTNEYQLDYLIHTFKKPIICWGHGIVMGGGLGMMVGASHRIVTETSRIAMPEITIGLYPDVAGSWFLNRMPGRTGLYLGLTGSSINASDALFLNLADNFVNFESQEAVLVKLLECDWSNNCWTNCQYVTDILQGFEQHSRESLPISNIRKYYDLIQLLTQKSTIAAVVDDITQLESDDKWLVRGIESLKSGCPTTAHLVDQQLKRAKHLSLKEVFMMELIISVQCARHPDFSEGVRALLIDRDNQPDWQYKSVNEVPREWIEEHFVSPWGDMQHHPLQAM